MPSYRPVKLPCFQYLNEFIRFFFQRVTQESGVTKCHCSILFFKCTSARFCSMLSKSDQVLYSLIKNIYIFSCPKSPSVQPKLCKVRCCGTDWLGSKELEKMIVTNDTKVLFFLIRHGRSMQSWFCKGCCVKAALRPLAISKI